MPQCGNRQQPGEDECKNVLDEAAWQARRSLFPILRTTRYVAACSQGPLSTRVEGAMARFMDSWRSIGNPWEQEWIPTVMRAADRFAQLINAPPSSIGVTTSVSAALVTMLSALDFSERPKVIASALDFPTLPDILLAHRQKGLIELDILPEQNGEIPFEAYERAVDGRTGLVCLSSASYATGALFPIQKVAELSRARGALCLVDAFQTMGALKLDVCQVKPDFVITGTLKYVLGTQGAALMYIAPELAPGLEPTAIGWMAAADPFGTNFDRLEYAAGAARFQGDTFGIASCYAADTALELLAEIGIDAIEQRVVWLTRRFINGLEEIGVRPNGPTTDGKVGPMVAVPVSGDAHEWQERLRHEEAIVTAARGNALRFAFHFYNDGSDVDACLDVVKRCLRS